EVTTFDQEAGGHREQSREGPRARPLEGKEHLEEAVALRLVPARPFDQRGEGEGRRREVWRTVASLSELLPGAFNVGEGAIPVTQLEPRRGSPCEAMKLEVDRLILHRSGAEIGEAEGFVVVGQLVAPPRAGRIDVTDLADVVEVRDHRDAAFRDAHHVGIEPSR